MAPSPRSSTSSSPPAIKFRETLQDLIDRSPFKSNRKPIWEALNITSAALSQYLQGQSRPRLEVLVALADFFGVSLDYLVLGRETVQPIEENRSSAKYLDWALADVQSKVEKQTWLTARVGQILATQLSQTVQEVAAMSPGFAGMASDDELLILEQYSLHTRLLTRHLNYNVIPVGDELVVARFGSVVARNLLSNPLRPYQFLVPEEDWESLQPSAYGFRKLLREEFGVTEERLRSCEIRLTSHRFVSGSAFYQLDFPKLREEQPIIAAAFEPYINKDGSLGYVIHPNEDTQGEVLFGANQLGGAMTEFSRMWREAKPAF